MRLEILEAALGDVEPLERVIELDRSQPEFTLTFDEYLARVVPLARVEKGPKEIPGKSKAAGGRRRALWRATAFSGRTLGDRDGILAGSPAVFQ